MGRRWSYVSVNGVLWTIIVRSDGIIVHWWIGVGLNVERNTQCFEMYSSIKYCPYGCQTWQYSGQLKWEIQIDWSRTC